MQKEKQDAIQHCERMENDKVRTEKQLQETSAQVCIHSFSTNHMPVNSIHPLRRILLLPLKRKRDISHFLGASVYSEISS